MAKHIREEGNEKLLLFITFDLPFDEITDVHHCRDTKKHQSLMTKKWKKTLQSHSWGEFTPCWEEFEGSLFQPEWKTAHLKKICGELLSLIFQLCEQRTHCSKVQLCVTKPTATAAEGAAMSDKIDLQGTKVSLLCHYTKRLLKPHRSCIDNR